MGSTTSPSFLVHYSGHHELFSAQCTPIIMGKKQGGDKNASGTGGKGAKGGKGGNEKEEKKGAVKKNGLKIKIRHILWYVVRICFFGTNVLTTGIAKSNPGWKRP